MSHKSSLCLLAVFALCTRFTAAGQNADCGRADWNKVPYQYFPQHRPASSKETSLVRIGNKGTNVSLVVYKPEVLGARESENYFETADNGITWKALPHGDVPSNLPTAPFGYFQSASTDQVRFKLMQDSHLYLRSIDSGKTWTLPPYRVDGESLEAFAQNVANHRGYHAAVYIVGIHPKEPLTLYAGFKVLPWGNEGTVHPLPYVYKSSDGGESWTKFADRLRPFSLGWTEVSPIGTNPLMPNVMFATGTGGILKTTDSGNSWTPVGQIKELESRPVYKRELDDPKVKMMGAPASQTVYQFAFDAHDAETVYMLSDRGVFKTVDGGNTWRLLNLGFDEIDAIYNLALSPLDSRQIFIGSRYGLFMSSDSGCHFRRLQSPGEPQPKAAVTAYRSLF